MILPQFPQMEPQIARPEDKPEFQREIFHPSWACFCCQDTAIVRPYLVRLIIRDYDWSRDKLPICRSSKCKNAPTLANSITQMFDIRFTETMCNQLDEFARQDWKHTVEAQQKAIKELAEAKSMRERDRTPEEIQIAEERVKFALQEANSESVLS